MYLVGGRVVGSLPPLSVLRAQGGVKLDKKDRYDVIVVVAGPGDSLFIVTPSEGTMLYNSQARRPKPTPPFERSPN